MRLSDALLDTKRVTDNDSSTNTSKIFCSIPLKYHFENYQIRELYDIDFDALGNRNHSRMDITRLRIPVVKLKKLEKTSSVSSISAEVKIPIIAHAAGNTHVPLSMIECLDEEVILLLNVGLSTEIFCFQNFIRSLESEYGFLEFVVVEGTSSEDIPTPSYQLLIHKNINTSVDDFDVWLKECLATNSFDISDKIFQLDVAEFYDHILEKIKVLPSDNPLTQDLLHDSFLSLYKKIHQYLEFEDVKAFENYRFFCSYDSDDFLSEVHNNTNEFVKKLIDTFDESYRSNESMKLTPDFYLLCSLPRMFNEYQDIFDMKRKSIEKLPAASSLKTLKLHYVNYLTSSERPSRGFLSIVSLICVIAQVIAPTYYVIDYFTDDEIDHCPHDSKVWKKIFAFSYFIIMFYSLQSLASDVHTVYSAYDDPKLAANRFFFYLGLISNIYLVYMIPFFTFVLLSQYQ